jgi:hypothetical protein
MKDSLHVLARNYSQHPLLVASLQLIHRERSIQSCRLARDGLITATFNPVFRK